VIEVSIARRVHRGLVLWRNQGAEIRPIASGGLCVPSCSEPGRIYRVSLADEGRCGCPAGVAASSPASCEYPGEWLWGCARYRSDPPASCAEGALDVTRRPDPASPRSRPRPEARDLIGACR